MWSTDLNVYTTPALSGDIFSAAVRAKTYLQNNRKTLNSGQGLILPTKNSEQLSEFWTDFQISNNSNSYIQLSSYKTVLKDILDTQWACWTKTLNQYFCWLCWKYWRARNIWLFQKKSELRIFTDMLESRCLIG
jgi:hypothetical protein